MIREDILKIFLEDAPAARSPYGLYGHPPMWRILAVGDREILARPGRTMVRLDHAWKEVDGIHWQERRADAWFGQAMSADMETFLGRLAEWEAETRKIVEETV